MTKSSSSSTARPGELALAADPAQLASDGQIVFIGQMHTPWTTRETCPKNMREARTRNTPATIEINAVFREGLLGLDAYSHVLLLTWMHESRRDLIVQVPRHLDQPRGVFALRSPARPNPIGVGVARLLAVDAARGVLTIDASDCLDGTPVIDVKPYFPGADAVPDARIP
jgi:tRNA-Thr(GGU) m(6)t(6)A37 methyltransferase TsaA